MMALFGMLVFAVICILGQSFLASAQPGFLSLDCGANESYTDATGIRWRPDDAYITIGSNTSVPRRLSNNTILPPLQSLRSFPGGEQKFCYSLPVNASQRYLIRATFLYGNYDGLNTAPEFPLYLNATRWADVQIEAVNKEIFEEMIVLSTGKQLDVCIVKGAAGIPFISTLELRQLIGSMYSVSYELRAHLKHVVRINFGALTVDDVRYPDDEVDRIWKSDILKPNNLAHEADGTVRINTTTRVGLSAVSERPPQKVLQTAVVGTNGNITYRYLIPEFPAFAFAKTYFAEIETLKPTDVRAFTFILPNDTQFRGQVVNLAKDIGVFQGYAPGYDNLTLKTIINFGFEKTPSANLGPILNAMEILRIVPKQAPTNPRDVDVLNEFIREFQLDGLGDPCIPAIWEWVTCSQDPSPRITGLFLSDRNLSGTIPPGISTMTSLIDIRLSNNSLTGPIPDLSQLSALKNLHLEDNMLSGPFPESVAGLGNLQELDLENNLLTGSVPGSLLTKSGLDFQYSGNPGLCITDCPTGSHSKAKRIGAIVGGVIGGMLLCLAVAAAVYFLNIRRKPVVKSGKSKSNAQDSLTSMMSTYRSQASDSGSIIQEQGSDQAHRFTYQELKEASNNFSNKVGSGGFGTVYYGMLKTGKEVAIKVLSADSHQGTREFANEVTLLSRIHHRNLVSLLGYCQEDKQRILVYEYMHVGTLRDCLYATSGQEHLNWITKLKVALDAAKGLDYLHTGCNPSIIHRDVKSSNILISSNKVGKVADFGLSKLSSEETSLVSTTVRGTVGYLDPEYYMTQRLTEKSDVYSFGIVLLEMISAREPTNPELFHPESNIVQWARVALQKGNIESIIDPALGLDYLVESMWKTAEVAMFCVEPYGVNRPTMGEVVRDLQEAYELESTDRNDPAAEDEEQQPSTGPGYHLDYAPRNPLQSINLSSVFAEPHARRNCYTVYAWNPITGT